MDEMEILSRHAGTCRQTAVFEGRRLMEYYEEAEAERSLVGTIFLGRVRQVLPKVGAAFVDIGEKKNGFLPIKEMESFQESGSAGPLVTGQDVVVQVKKDAKDEKGAFLTRDIALPGQYCIYMPMNRHVGVSGRVAEEQRDMALALGREIAAGQAGIIVRHAALFARPQDVRDEHCALAETWRETLKKAPFLKSPATLRREATACEMLVRDYSARFAVTLRTDGPGADETAINHASHTALEMEALWQGARAEWQLEEALGRRVDLPGGGTLVVDEGEALTAIDVNTARFTGEAGEDIALSQNLAACEEIARQIRLRNLGGMVLVDFIDMKTDEQRQRVVKRLEEALQADRIKTVIHGFTSLGLLEMTRKRTRESLRDLRTEPCPHCGGTGRKLKKP